MSHSSPARLPLRGHRQPSRVARASRWGLALAAALSATLTVSTTNALAVGHGTLATSAPVTFPGTDQTVDSWRLIGGGQASATQIAPRWVLSAGHAPADGGIWTTDRGSSPAIATYLPIKASWAKADMALTLLRDPLPAPASGWPRLLREAPGALVDVLPGQVLFAGLGGTSAANLPTPTVGWATPAGLRAPGLPRLQAIGGDSGSSAFWHVTPTSRPVMTAISANEDLATNSPWTLNSQRTFSSSFSGPADNSSATSFGPWIREQIAKHPDAAAPDWVDLNDVVSLSSLRPLPPTNLRVRSATASSVTLDWAHSTETRAPRTGYRVSRPGFSVDLPASATSYTATNLSAGTTYALTVRAINANGESPTVDAHPATVDYLVRTGPAAVQNAAFAARKGFTGGNKADYCAEATWTAPVATPGTTITGYVITFDGVSAPAAPITPSRSGVLTTRKCGLAPGTNHSFVVTAVSDATPSATPITVSGSIPAAASLGTPIGGPTGVTNRGRISTATGAVDGCLDVSWQAPAGVSGWPVQRYSILITDGSGGGVKSDNDISTSVRSTTICGLEPSEAYAATVFASFDVTATLSSRAEAVDLPAAAPRGTAILPVTGLRAPVTTRFLASACANVAWTNPAPIQGAPVGSHQVRVFPSAGGAAVAISGVLPASTSSVRLCGLTASKSYRVEVTTTYATGGTIDASAATTR